MSGICEKAILLFRESGIEDENELDSAKNFWRVCSARAALSNRKEKIVVGRYSVLPFYKELEEDIAYLGKKLINSYAQHRYIATMGWLDDIGQDTFDTWFDHNFYQAPEGAYVVKGETNSKKLQWNKKMFAPTKADALRIAGELVDDGGILGQRIAYRKYMPLRTYSYGLNGLPITEEWRYFCYKGDILARGFYWQDFIGKCPDKTPPLDAYLLAKKTAKTIADHANFYVIDVARTQEGDCVVVEVNDAQMSGLCGVDANTLYSTLARTINDEESAVEPKCDYL